MRYKKKLFDIITLIDEAYRHRDEHGKTWIGFNQSDYMDLMDIIKEFKYQEK